MPIKLTPNYVLEIVELLKKTETSSEVIGKKFDVSGRMVRAINSGESWKSDDLSYPIRQNLHQIDNRYTKCKVCGEEIKEPRESCSYRCSAFAQRTKERPKREVLKNLIREKPFTKIGEKYEVSDNAIRKWCSAYGLPTRKKDIKKYTDREWADV